MVHFLRAVHHQVASGGRRVAQHPGRDGSHEQARRGGCAANSPRSGEPGSLSTATNTPQASLRPPSRDEPRGGNVVAISVPAPTDRFLDKEKRIVWALRAAAASAVWIG